MPDGAVIDTDVLLKSSAYHLAHETVAVLSAHGEPAALGLAHLIAPRQLRRKRLADPARAAAELDALLANLAKIEPSDDEIELAAELATQAQELGLALDTGEAQIAAIVATRGASLMVTGDKRAISALAALLPRTDLGAALAGRVACLEQLILAVSAIIGGDATRARICAEPEVDTALRLACSCGRRDWAPVELEAACGSYIEDVRRSVGNLLRAGLSLA